MIYTPLSNFVRSTEEPLAPTTVISAPGQALVQEVTATGYAVKPSTGAAGEVFVGFANTETSAASFQQGTTTRVEEFTLSGAGVCNLSAVPVGGTLFVWDITAGAPIVSANYTVSAAGQFTAATAAGHAVRFTYTKTLTTLQARAMFGDVTPGGYAGYVVGQIGVGRQGVIYTDQFDTSVNWAGVASGALTLGANGKLTVGGAGTPIQGFVKAIPSVMHPFLGVDFVA